MQQFRIVVTPHAALDVRGAGVCTSAHTLGIESVTEARVVELYFVRGELRQEDVARLCDTLLADPAAHAVHFTALVAHQSGEADSPGGHAVEVAYLPGVMDPLALQLARATRQIGLPPIDVATGTRYELYGDLTTAQVVQLTERLLCNATVQHYALGTIDPKFTNSNSRANTPSPNSQRAGEVSLITLSGLDKKALQVLSKTRLLSLSVEEMHAIQEHFGELGREPTDVELETLAQTWSEHCVHKTFKAIIEYTNERGEVEIIDGLLNSTIKRATEEINAPWVRSAFVDNAGIIDFDDNWELSFKCETHNHPSALEPFGGANTGVGGVIRDIMGVSARPIAITDVLCFGPQDLPFDQLPAGSLHPRRVKEGVVAGIADYGNKLGIPTVAGAVYYDPGYTANPLVFAGCVGIAPKGSHPTGANPGDYVVVLGGRTGRDGLHGATFSSDALAHDTGQVAGTAVQIGNPIVQKDVLEVIIRARDAKLYTAITDCGAGGLSSAVGEMAEHPGGVDVELADVPLKYPGLAPWEIWLSEAQERMVLAVNPANWIALRELCADWNVEATRIGTFTSSGRLMVRYRGRIVADLTLKFMKDGLPRLRLKAIAPVSNFDLSDWEIFSDHLSTIATDTNDYLLSLLANPNVASKEDIIRRYDHEIRGSTIIKPLIGIQAQGPSDGAVLKLLETVDHLKGFALAIGHGLEFGQTRADVMARAGVFEAVDNLVAVGTDPARIALLDNFCWGDPKDAERLGTLVQAARSCSEIAVELGVPFISGKDSLNNVYIETDGKRISIPDTLIISAIGTVPDVTKAITTDLKQAGNSIYLFYGILCNDLRLAYRALHQAIMDGYVVACHDISYGGIALTAAEMCIAGQLGLRLKDVGSHISTAFYNAGYGGDFILEMSGFPDNDIFRECADQIGEVIAEPRLIIEFGIWPPIIDLPISELTAAYKREGKYAR